VEASQCRTWTLPGRLLRRGRSLIPGAAPGGEPLPLGDCSEMWSPVEELAARNQQPLTGGGSPSPRKVLCAEHCESARLESEIASVRREMAERDRMIEQLQAEVEALKGGDGFHKLARRFQAELAHGRWRWKTSGSIRWRAKCRA
jgi:hypothetical protein